jgi:hypothetical protein
VALSANQIESAGVSVDRLVAAVGGPAPARLLPHFIGRGGTAEELHALEDFSDGLGQDQRRTAELVGLILASPAFQMY